MLNATINRSIFTILIQSFPPLKNVRDQYDYTHYTKRRYSKFPFSGIKEMCYPISIIFQFHFLNQFLFKIFLDILTPSRNNR